MLQFDHNRLCCLLRREVIGVDGHLGNAVICGAAFVEFHFDFGQCVVPGESGSIRVVADPPQQRLRCCLQQNYEAIGRETGGIRWIDNGATTR
jgi:hypothetical protein